MVDIRVHIDTLEYTRQGLRTRDRTPLTVGQHNRVVLVRPRRLPSVAASYAGFAPDLSFPGPAVLSALKHEHRAFDGVHTLAQRLQNGAKLQVFGHTDATGSESDNKTVSDRRAECVLALLTCDVDRVVNIARDEEWGLDVQQVMLRALGCDPGPIDGQTGDLTRAAVETFQQTYLDGAFYEEGESQRRPGLVIDGDLGPNTAAALVEAYVSRFSPRLPHGAFVQKAPANGCAFHNPVIAPDCATNRRVSLVIHATPLAYPESTPCTSGEAMACPALDTGALQRCMWFYEHVFETPFEEAGHHHFLPSWLKLENGNYMLSVLTTVPDAEPVEFQVFAAKQPADGSALPDPSVHLYDIGPPVTSQPVHGVAQVVWEPPPDFAPAADGRTNGPSGRFVPMFRVTHARSQALLHDSYPATEIVVLLARAELGGALSGHENVEFELSHDSGLVMKKASTEATDYDAGHLALRFAGVPENGQYSLTLYHGDAEHRRVFENVPYRELCEADEMDGCEGPASTCEHWSVPPVPAPLGSTASQPHRKGLDLLSGV